MLNARLRRDEVDDVDSIGAEPGPLIRNDAR
jgi:hypothetical protein